MCWPWPMEDLYWVWSQKVKGQGQIDFKFFTVCITPFPCGIHCWYFTHVLTITWGRPLLILGQRVKFGLQTFYYFHTITDFQFDIQWWYFTHVFPITGTRPLIMLGWKSQGQILLWILHCFRMITPLPFDIQWWYYTHEFIMTQGGPLLIFGSFGQRSRSNTDFELFKFSAL